MITTFAQAAAAPWDGWAECQAQQSVWTGWMNPGECIEAPAATVANAIGNEVIQPYVDDMKSGVSTAVKTMVTFWVSVPDPNLGGVGSDPVNETVGFLQAGLNPLTALIMAFMVLFGCVATIWTNRGEPAKNILQMVLTYIVVQSALAGAVTVGLEVINVTSRWLIDQSTVGTSFGDNLVSLFDSTEGVGSAILLIVFLLIAAIIAAFTCILMIARMGFLICLVGAAGLAAVMGQSATRHYLAWIIALGFYKLAAAIIYAVGFRLLGTDTAAAGNGFLQILQGLTLLLMAVLALPACIRLIVPAVAPTAQGRGAGAAAAGAGAAAATALVRR